jgi:hypothetical protein
MTKEKIIKLIYLFTCITLLFLFFIYPSPPRSKVANYLNQLGRCKIELINPNNIIHKEIDEFFYKYSCPGQKALITITTKNFNYYFGIIISLLFITLNLIIWRTRKYAVCLAFYLNKGLKNIFKKI